MFIQLPHLPVRLFAEVGDGGIHADMPAPWEIPVDQIQDGDKPLCRQAKGVPVTQKDSHGISADSLHPQELFFDGCQRNFTIRQVLE